MHRWSPLNERQLALLDRLANGKESEEPWDPGEFRTAYALRDRGLVTIKRSGSKVDAQVTEAGTFYLQHGHHPDDPAHAGEEKAAKGKATGGTRSASYADRPVALARRAKAKELIETTRYGQAGHLHQARRRHGDGVATRDRLREAPQPHP
ncbi:hypothetical protein AB0A05_00595 [Streptomyces sp. NPDC046374]|uniref:hypothetical protein n=1 Tax=Streptomyces sp. NPDC046374 TaxID=3154917 RepID=UPI0033E6E679